MSGEDNSKLTHTDRLPFSVTVAGTKHRDFELRLPTVQDNIDAVDEVGSHNQVAVSAFILSRQLVKLGTLKPEEITYELISGLHPRNYNALEEAANALEKKLSAAELEAELGTKSDSA
jgi:hypothetical protein